ncbi:MAG: hypothetical protein ACTHKK_11245, partial [Candidatus Nitrosocosmicus sp.]
MPTTSIPSEFGIIFVFHKFFIITEGHITFLAYIRIIGQSHFREHNLRYYITIKRIDDNLLINKECQELF